MNSKAVSSSLNVSPTPLPVGCQGCRFYADCGGLPEQASFWGCFTDCETVCQQQSCDWTCPGRQNVFVDRWREVGGWPPRPATMLKPLSETDLPLYIPMIQHGKRRSVPLALPIVAIPTFRVIHPLRGERYGAQAKDADELRQEFQLAKDTRILLVSIAQDKHLEAYWRYHKEYALSEQLETMNVIGMTVPNYSFFSDAPRTHTLWNRMRMIRVAEELSQAGICVVPHINALTQADWDFWTILLKEQPWLNHVAKEFQTGLAHKDAGLKHLEALRRMQDKVGRDLYPIVVGAARFTCELAKGFRRFALVDSEPFMKTMHRRILISRGYQRPYERKQFTGLGEPLDNMLVHSIHQYSSWVKQTVVRATSNLEVQSIHNAPNPVLPGITDVFSKVQMRLPY